MASGFLFGGQFTRRPTVRAKVDDFGLIPFSTGTPRIVAIIGKAEGGEPGAATLVSNPNEALRTFRRGELVDAIRRCFDPTQAGLGTSQVQAVRVNPATKATLALKDAGAATAIDVSSINWGLEENQIKIKIEDGTSGAPLKKVTIAKGVELYVGDDLGRVALTLQYTGTGTAATMSITGTALTTAITGGPGGETLNIDLNTYDTIQKLVDVIDASAVYTATRVYADGAAKVLNGLDVVTAVDIKTALYSVRADNQALVEWFNSPKNPLVSATRGASGKVPANVAYTYLAGGSEGTTTTTQWQNALDALQSKDVVAVVPVTSDAAVHAMADTHAALMAADGKKPRKAYVGAALGEKTANLTNYVNRAMALNSDRTVLICQGLGGFDDAGKATVFPPYVVAAQVAGAQTGVQTLGDAITFLPVKATKLEWTPTTGELDLGIGAGLFLFELAENLGIFRVSRGITTWRSNDGYHRVEISTGMALDEVVRRVVEGLEIFIGKKASPVTIHRVASRTQSILKSLEAQEIIVGDAASPAFSGITASIAGDVISVSFQCQPVVPVNFVAVTIQANTFTSAISVATQ